MFRLLAILFTLALWGAPALQAQTPGAAESQRSQEEQRQTPPEAMPEAAPVMREYRSVKLGMNREDVKAVMGETSQAGQDWDEFKLGGGDLMTLRYDAEGVVKTIQLYFTNPERAPKWIEVVGNAEIQQKPTGSKYARAVNKEENFWATMFQSKNGDVTTITLSR
jgi:hypothetical protein